MKLNRKAALQIVLGIFFLAVCYIFGIRYIARNINLRENTGGESSKSYVAVISKSMDSAFWKSVFAGANAAGTEYNLRLTIEGPDNEEDYRTQNEMIERAVANGAEAIVFSAADYNANAEAIDEAARRGVKIVVIDSDVNSSQVSCRISTDNYRAGRQAGEAVTAREGEEIRVGIVNFDRNAANGQQREEGLRDALAEDPRVEIVDAINVMSTTADSKKGTEEMLKAHPDIDVIATFNEWTSLGVGYAIRDLDASDKTDVVAFDSNVVSVGMLETGEVDALIVQNPYAMGYLGVECAYQLLNGIPLESEEVDMETTLITQENMFDEECQKVLFAFD